MADDLYDVTIVGGGPVGLFTAFYSGMRNLKTKLLESSGELGGKITQFYPEKTIRDIGGIQAVTGAGLVRALIGQAKTFAPAILCNRHVSGLERMPDGSFLLKTDNGEPHHTKTIILTAGAGIFKPVKLDVKGAERFESGNLYYTIEQLEVFRNKRVVISGGGNAAVDWANELAPVAERVSVIHRRDLFGGFERQVCEMKKLAEVFTPYKIKSLYGEGESIRRVEIEHADTGEMHWLEADAVIVNHGIYGDYGGILNWGLAMQEGRFVVNGAMETNIAGIFAAGDAVTYPHKLKLIAGGFAEGPVAVNSAAKYISPDAELMAMYSTHHERFTK
ncbi:ferredoxin--NADP reductase 1 [Weizmannia acidilactici]|uniref:Ferredoxin--NADP reductase n=1 Tax=Weizmannia acidilactici TaxID=2607726 RepID=A0A5J4JEY2_9BACI|nr:NAD(P)/FAD-dependent oxidoreductase [Weizmannia acidilactici]GER66643.1 ferredoxin--NADP reductase 1 [Weizmannia acidilactici]GER70643.1 ferredoxin--NADP reductase 1 [Weizmannia acidilactici]GER72803.1 ferredoxin--NADP reductase 1 [Weizmannia acidilactici]